LGRPDLIVEAGRPRSEGCRLDSAPTAPLVRSDGIQRQVVEMGSFERAGEPFEPCPGVG
jgi:hypothetical protein